MDLDPRDDFLLRTRRTAKHYAADGRKLADLDRVGAMTPDTDPEDRAATAPIVPVNRAR